MPRQTTSGSTAETRIRQRAQAMGVVNTGAGTGAIDLSLPSVGKTAEERIRRRAQALGMVNAGATIPQSDGADSSLYAREPVRTPADTGDKGSVYNAYQAQEAEKIPLYTEKTAAELEAPRQSYKKAKADSETAKRYYRGLTERAAALDEHIRQYEAQISVWQTMGTPEAIAETQKLQTMLDAAYQASDSIKAQTKGFEANDGSARYGAGQILDDKALEQLRREAEADVAENYAKQAYYYGAMMQREGVTPERAAKYAQLREQAQKQYTGAQTEIRDSLMQYDPVGWMQAQGYSIAGLPGQGGTKTITAEQAKQLAAAAAQRAANAGNEADRAREEAFAKGILDNLYVFMTPEELRAQREALEAEIGQGERTANNMATERRTAQAAREATKAKKAELDKLNNALATQEAAQTIQATKGTETGKLIQEAVAYAYASTPEERAEVAKRVPYMSPDKTMNLENVQETEYEEYLRAIKRALKADGYDKQAIENTVETLRREFNAERQRQLDESIDKTMSRSGFGGWLARWGMTLASVPVNLLSGVGMLAPVATALNGSDYTTVDPNSGWFGATNAVNSIRSAHQKYNAGGEVNDMLYGIITSSMDSVLGSLVGSGITSGLGLTGKAAAWVGGSVIGAEAAAQSMQDIAARGGNVSQVLSGGLMAGAFETFFEQFSLAQLQGLSQIDLRSALADGKLWKTIAENVGKGMLTNGSEELFTELANVMYDTYTMGELSNYAESVERYMAWGLSEEEARKRTATELANQVLEAGFTGALQGLLMDIGGLAAHGMDTWADPEARAKQADSDMEEWRKAVKDWWGEDALAEAEAGQIGLVRDGYVKSALDSGTAERLDSVAKALGLNVRFVDRVAGGMANSSIKGNQVLIEKGNPNPLNFLFGHEITHRMQELAPAQYQRFKELVANEADTRQDARETADNYRQKGLELTDAGAMDEAVSDYAGRMMEDGRLLDDFIRRHSGERTLLETLRDAFRALIEKLHGGERRQAQLAVDRLNRALDTAAANAQNNTAAQESGGEKELFSIKQLKSGEKYVDVDVDQNRFVGLSVPEMQTEAKKVILEKFRDKVVGKNYTSYVNKRTAEHYAYPANRRMDITQKIDKMHASPELDNLLDAATFRENVPDDGRHPSATGGLDKLDVKFRVNGRMYDAEITVLVTDHGRIFYDMTKFRDITGREIGLTQGAAETSDNVSVSSISKSDAEVNTDFSLKGTDHTRAGVERRRNGETRDLRLPAVEPKETTPRDLRLPAVETQAEDSDMDEWRERAVAWWGEAAVAAEEEKRRRDHGAEEADRLRREARQAEDDARADQEAEALREEAERDTDSARETGEVETLRRKTTDSFLEDLTEEEMQRAEAEANRFSAGTEDAQRARQRDLDEYWESVRQIADVLEPRTVPEDMVSTKVQKKTQGLGEKAREAWSYFKRKMVDSGEAVTRIGKAVGDQNLYYFYNMARSSSNAATSMIVDGRTDIYGRSTGKGLNEVMGPVRNKGDEYYKKFQLFLFHMHNVDRMSRFSQSSVDSAQAAMEDFRMTNPELMRYPDFQIERMAADESSAYYFESCEYMELRNALQKAENTTNKPVFGFDVTAEESKAEADKLLRENPEFKTEAQEVYAYIDNLLRYRVDSGLITEEDYQQLKSAYPHYVPTYRVFEREAADTRRKNRVQIGSTIKQATGSSERLMPLHKALAQQTMSVVREGSKNRFGMRLLNSEAQKKAMEHVRSVQEYHGDFSENSFDQPEDRAFQKKNTFVVRENGKLWEMEVSPALYEAVQALSPDTPETNVFTRVVRKTNNLFKSLVTGRNPTFMARNFMRDLQDAGLYSKDLSEFVKQYPQAWTEIAKNGAYWQQYKALGGTFSSVFDYDIGEVAKGNKLYQKTFGRVEAINMAIEQAPRLAEFMATVKKAERRGEVTMEDLMEAMYNAADVTVNFGRSGTLGKVLNANYVPFLNPGIQGFSKMIRNVTETKGAKNWARLVVKAAALGILAGKLNELIFGDEEDWDALKDRDKDVYYLFKIGDHLWLKLPKGRTLSLLGMTADRISDLARGEKVDWAGYIDTALSQTAPANPLENNILQAWFDADLFDKDSPGETWYGSDIESQRLRNYAPAERYDAKTDVVSRWLGKTFNLSPAKINYLLDQYSGVVGDMLLPLMTPAAERDMVRAAFTIDSAYSNRYASDFYGQMDELTYQKNAENATGADNAIYRYWNKQSSAVSEINKAIREIEADETLSNKEKRELCAAQYAIRNGIMSQALETYETYAEAVRRNYDASALEDEDERVDEAYREANRDVLGAEYALSTYNKSVYATAQELNQETGLDYDTFYDFYFAKKDAEDSNEKRDIIRSLDATDEQKKALYRKYISDSKDEKMDAFERAGLDFDQFLETHNEYARINETEKRASEKATEFTVWVSDQRWTKAQKDTALECFKYYTQTPAKASDYRAIQNSDLRTGDKLMVMKSTMSEEAYDGYVTAWKSGLEQEYFDALEIKNSTKEDKDAQGKGIKGSTNLKVMREIDKMKLTNKQKESLYDCLGYKDKENMWNTKYKGRDYESYYYMSESSRKAYLDYCDWMSASDFSKHLEACGKLKTDPGKEKKSDPGQTKKEKVIAYINGLNLINDQKSALYVAMGYSVKTLDDCPWYNPLHFKTPYFPKR